MAFTSLNHHLDLSWLSEAFWSLRRDAAPGVDGQTFQDYQANLDANLRSLLERAKSGTYRAPPVRRVYIPKGSGSLETRPIGIPTLEDKILQRAVVMALESIYEQDSSTARTASGQGGRHTRRWRTCGGRRQARALVGCWRSISGSSSTLWITAICVRCWREGYATGCCFG